MTLSIDEKLRRAQRTRDAPLELSLRIRAGLLTREHVDLAASLGHAAAYALCSDTEQVKWGDWVTRRDVIFAAASLLGDTLPMRVAADWAERVLHVYESGNPGDTRPREAISATKAWADCPCDDHRIAADAASASAYCAASASASYEAAYAAHASAHASAAASAHAFASSHAASAVSQAVSAVSYYATARAVTTTAARAAVARAAEHEWQRLRLAAYLLGEC